MIAVTIEPAFSAFRERARALLADGVAPAEVTFHDGTGQASLFGEAPGARAPKESPGRVPAAFVRLGELAAPHSSTERWDALYRVVYRLTHGEPDLLEVTTDPDTTALRRLVADVKHDEHRMLAFLRFTRVPGAEESFVAWYVPEHHILPLAAPHFARRYSGMRWVILTPSASAAWDGSSLRFGAGAARDAARAEDEQAALFQSYYGAIFNPARTNLALFGRHIPTRFQSEMPELAGVHALASSASERVDAMQKKKVSSSLAFVPAKANYEKLARAAKGCTACHLHENATQTVFGEGPVTSPLVLVGEQPGDQEDRAGHPFVGPVGRLLDVILEEQGIPRETLYVTNAVKHFKFEPRGKRRIHSKPNATEVTACNGWLEAEIALVKPKVIVCLGATAAQAFFGRTFKITEQRGELLDGAPWAKTMIATYHPSALLRMDDEETRDEARAHFGADLKKAAKLVGLL